MLSIEDRNRGDIVLSTAVFFPVSVLMIQYFLIGVNLIEYESFSIVSKILSAIPMIMALFWIIKRKLILLLVTYLVIVVLIILSLTINAKNGSYILSEGYYLLLINVPCFLGIASIRDINILRRVMLFISYLIFFFGIVYVLFVVLGIIMITSYAMSFSYFLLLPALTFVSKKEFGYSVLFIIILSIMILLGSRGGVLAAGLYAISLPLFSKEYKRNIILLVILVALLSTSLFALFHFIQEQAGFSSRTISLFLENDLLKSSGRIDIYMKTWQSILDSPILGYGIYGDRFLLGTYCHNFVLEMLYNFGLLFGSGLILIIFSKAVLVFLNLDKDRKKLQLALFFLGVFPLFFSNSYLNYFGFGIFLGSLFWTIPKTDARMGYLINRQSR